MGCGRGGLVPSELKSETVDLIRESRDQGARLKKACETLELPFRTFLRWQKEIRPDGRHTAKRRIPRKLTEEERETFLEVANSERFCDQTPGQIVANLLEEGTYYGSERTLYRLLRERQALSP